MTITIYHNPACSTSRKTLAILEERGVAPVVVQYLKTPLTRDALAALVAKMGVAPRELVRWKEKETVALAGISEASPDSALLAAMAAHPILMNRPVVVTDKGAKLCRPQETVSELL
jgi:arsenate reductase